MREKEASETGVTLVSCSWLGAVTICN